MFLFSGAQNTIKKSLSLDQITLQILKPGLNIDKLINGDVKLTEDGSKHKCSNLHYVCQIFYIGHMSPNDFIETFH